MQGGPYLHAEAGDGLAGDHFVCSQGAGVVGASGDFLEVGDADECGFAEVGCWVVAVDFKCGSSLGDEHVVAEFGDGLHHFFYASHISPFGRQTTTGVVYGCRHVVIFSVSSEDEPPAGKRYSRWSQPAVSLFSQERRDRNLKGFHNLVA